MSGSDWSPVHHEDMEDEEPVSPARAAKETKAATKPDKESDGPALILTIPPNMIAGLWSLSEALKENTEALKAHTEAMKARED